MMDFIQALFLFVDFLASIFSPFSKNEPLESLQNIPNVRMSASPSEVFSDAIIADVRQSWTFINSDLEALGYGCIMKILESYPEYKDLFRTAKSVPMTELKHNKEFMNHCKKVGDTVNQVVENIDKLDVLEPVLLELGKTHVRHKVFGENLLKSEPIILKFLRDSLKEHATPRVMRAWKKVLHYCVDTMVEGQQESK